jgi:hypothetical protein
MTKCQQCKYGANIMGFRGSMYNFKQAIKKVGNKIIEIDYENGGSGCRKSEDNDKERECLENNFCNFEEFIY